MIVCSRCILNSEIPDISFDDDVVCNYCHEHEEMVNKYPAGEAGRDNLDSVINEIKKSGKNNEYDCIIGVSGGADSTYSLYQAVKHGLRPLAVLFDNGWSSEIAVSNIKNATSKLNVDLETFVVDWEEFKSILIAFLKASVPDTDVPTDIGIKATLYKKVVENKTKYIITGGNFRTEGRIPRKWSYMDGRYIRSVYKQFERKNLSHFPNLTMLDYIYYIFLRCITVIGILNYMPYDKKAAVKFIESELGWRDYGGKHYESIFTRFNQTKIRYEKFGFDMRLIEYAALVRSGQLERDAALKKIENPPFEENQLDSDTDYVIKKLGLERGEFDEIFARAEKSYVDFPTYDPFIRRIRPILNFVSRYVKRL